MTSRKIIGYFLQIIKINFSGTLAVSRMLHCLHSFCEECLSKKLVGEGGDAGTSESAIDCPTCGYNTKVFIYLLRSMMTYRQMSDSLLNIQLL